jgi:hypothetical protein
MMKKTVMKFIPFFKTKFATVRQLPHCICWGKGVPPQVKNRVPMIKKKNIVLEFLEFGEFREFLEFGEIVCNGLALTL